MSARCMERHIHHISRTVLKLGVLLCIILVTDGWIVRPAIHTARAGRLDLGQLDFSTQGIGFPGNGLFTGTACLHHRILNISPFPKKTAFWPAPEQSIMPEAGKYSISPSG
ncbi:hypothetical protein [Desulfobacter vibrioformis]|uniref:hypothetical protein n=1 Tax=Desulfobacter vibrioformis TaxID=34031 RepID=UPI0005510B78|nr:hypothetical protein [Desulfobacter vibrioformis]